MSMVVGLDVSTQAAVGDSLMPPSITRILSERVDCAITNLALRLTLRVGDNLPIGGVVLNQEYVVDARSDVPIEGEGVRGVATDRDTVHPPGADDIGWSRFILCNAECELKGTVSINVHDDVDGLKYILEGGMEHHHGHCSRRHR
jgi:hypothetical protein